MSLPTPEQIAAKIQDEASACRFQCYMCSECRKLLASAIRARDEAHAAQLRELVEENANLKRLIGSSGRGGTVLDFEGEIEYIKEMDVRAESRQTERVTCEGNVIYSRVGTIPKSSSSTTIKQGETDVPSTDSR